MRETNKAKVAFEDYYNMGPGRSLRKLAQVYSEPSTEKPPTKHFATLAVWSNHHGWQNRVAQRDIEISTAQFEAIKSKAVEAGYAYWPKRVQDLVALGELLLGEINTEDKRWLPDVKQIGSGYMAEKIEIVRFNSALIEQFRRTLDDIAAEMGERIKGIAVSGPDGGPIDINFGATARDTLLGRLLSPTSPQDEGRTDKTAIG